MFKKTIAVSSATWKVWIQFINLETGRQPFTIEEALYKAHLNTYSFKKRKNPVSFTDWVRARNKLAEAFTATRKKMGELPRGTDEYRAARKTLLHIKNTLDEAEAAIGGLLSFLPDDGGNIVRSQILCREIIMKSYESLDVATLRDAEQVVAALQKLEKILVDIIEPHLASHFPPPWLRFVQDFIYNSLRARHVYLEGCRLDAIRTREKVEGKRRQEEYRESILAALEGYESLELRNDENHITHDVILRRGADIPPKDDSKFTLTIYPHPGKFNRTLLALLEILDSEIAAGRNVSLRVPKDSPARVDSIIETEALRFSFSTQAGDDAVVSLARKISVALERDHIEPHPKMLSHLRKPNCHPALAIASPVTAPTGGMDAFARIEESERYERSVRDTVGNFEKVGFRSDGESPSHYLIAPMADGVPAHVPSPHELVVYSHPDRFSTTLTALLAFLSSQRDRGHYFALQIPKQSPKLEQPPGDGTIICRFVIEVTENEVAWVVNELKSLPDIADVLILDRMQLDTQLTGTIHRAPAAKWTHLGGKLGIATISPKGDTKGQFEPRDTIGVRSMADKLVIAVASGFGPPKLAGPMARLVGEALLQKADKPIDHFAGDVFWDEVRRGILKQFRVTKHQNPGAAFLRVSGFWDGGLHVEYGGNVRLMLKKPGENGLHILSLDQSTLPSWVCDRELDDAGFHPPLEGELARRYYEDMRLGERETSTGEMLHSAEPGTPWDVTGGIFYQKREILTRPRVATYAPNLGRPWSAPGSLCIMMTPDVWRAVAWGDLLQLTERDLSPTDLAKTLVEKATMGTAVVFRF